VYALGRRYRLHVRKLPGCPDLVFRSVKKVIFVHGCFWHRHGLGCALTRLPKSRLDFWRPKLEENRKRDLRNMRKLRSMGWSVMVIWECELKDVKMLKSRIETFLGLAV
jgi:DNA mismatch endonuclease (patch repair protein)